MKNMDVANFFRSNILAVLFVTVYGLMKFIDRDDVPNDESPRKSFMKLHNYSFRRWMRQVRTEGRTESELPDFFYDDDDDDFHYF
ncbi:hypothetical protein MA16_Dca005244 [Dendrobium catenatum]|uniref:Uncharacterized protein n=1 Tax=Dendrobium catenatum TaxID=906689 RepID=A0A2I0VLP8_9ASPA|nr:hypothetical protein MA16_Dca005244 [Dendrobium catenatum]